MLTCLLALASIAGIAEGFVGGAFPSRWSLGTIDASGASAATGASLPCNSVTRVGRCSKSTTTRMTASEAAISKQQTYDYDSWAKVWEAALMPVQELVQSSQVHSVLYHIVAPHLFAYKNTLHLTSSVTGACEFKSRVPRDVRRHQTAPVRSICSLCGTAPWGRLAYLFLCSMKGGLETVVSCDVHCRTEEVLCIIRYWTYSHISHRATLVSIVQQYS